MVKYDGTSKPETWLSDYRVAVFIGGGNEHIAMRSLPLMLEGLARAWLNSLPTDGIHEWDDLERAFLKNFQGTYKHTGSVQDLWMCAQYSQRWTQLQKSIENVLEDQAINAFQHGVQYSLLQHKLDWSNDTSMGQMMEIANKYAIGEDFLQYEVRATKGKVNADFSGPKNQSNLGCREKHARSWQEAQGTHS